MKAEIEVNGMLTITAENPTEGYALQKWAETNVSEHTPQLTVSWSPENYKKNVGGAQRMSEYLNDDTIISDLRVSGHIICIPVPHEDTKP